jgi:hypothetical protein
MGKMNFSEIIVSRDDLLSALNVLTVATRSKHPPELVIIGQRGLVILKAGGASFAILGKGCIFGQARLSGKMIEALRQTIPDEPHIIIGQDAGQISFGTFRFGCTWEIFDKQPMQIPINASLGQVLGIWQRYTDEEIDKSGYRPQFEAADRERLERITKALELLMPMGITREDLETIVDEAIVRLNQGNYE